MTHCVILLLATLLAQAPQTVSPVGRSTQQTVKVEGCKGQAGCIAVPVDIGGTSVSATTTCHATTAAPTYVDGTDNPVSCDLSGGVRTTGGGGGGGTVAQGSGTGTAAGFWTARLSNGVSFLDPRDRNWLLTASDVVDVSDRSGRLLGHVTVDNASLAVTGTFWPTVAGSPSSARLSTGAAFYDARDRNWSLLNTTDSVNVGNFPATYDTSDRAARLLGVIYGSQAQQLKQTPTNFNTQIEIAVGSGLIDPRSIRALTSSDVVDVSDRAARLLGVIYGSQAQQLKQTPTNFNTQVETAVGGTLIDPRSIRALTASDIVTAAQGTAAATASGWPVKPTDGTNVITVKAGSTAAAAGDTSEVVALSPNSPLPTGANTVGAVNQGNAGSSAQAWYVRPRSVSTYTALYRLAARPYPLSNVFAAAGRKQFATIYHANTSAKIIKIREVLVMVRTISAAAIVSAEFVRLTSATTPATGNPAISPQFFDVSATLDATCLALPTTAGTENVNSIIGSWQFETAAVTPAVGSTEPPVDLPWKTLYSGDGASDEQLPIMAAGAAGGFAVILDANAAVTVTALVKIRFTEE